MVDDPDLWNQTLEMEDIVNAASALEDPDGGLQTATHSTGMVTRSRTPNKGPRPTGGGQQHASSGGYSNRGAVQGHPHRQQLNSSAGTCRGYLILCYSISVQILSVSPGYIIIC